MNSEIAELPAIEDFVPRDVGVSRDEALLACKNDLDFFAAVCLPEVYKFKFPPLYHAMWKVLCDELDKETGQPKFAIGLPRGFAKTLLLKLLTVRVIVFSSRRFPLIVCNTATLAENFIADVIDVLNSPNIIRLFGNWKIGLEKDTQELKKFTFRGRGIILAGLGSGSSLRGINLKYERPDVIIMDDMQSKEESDSAVESNKQLTWMLGTLMKANNKQRCLFVYLGNMYASAGCILKKLKHNASWTSFITGAILADGQSLWPELRSLESLLEELENDESMGHPEIFYAEVMNDEEAGSRSTVDFTAINIWEDSPEGLVRYHEGGFVIIDPALAKKASDDTAIGVCLLFDGEPVMWDIITGKFNEMQKIEECFKLCFKYGVMAIVVETAAYQESLKFWIEQKKIQLGLAGFRILTVSTGGVAKNSRIIAMTKSLTAKSPGSRFHIHVRLRSSVQHQLLHWNPLTKNNKDDILDVMAHCEKVVKENNHAILNPFEYLSNDIQASFSEDLSLTF